MLITDDIFELIEISEIWKLLFRVRPVDYKETYNLIKKGMRR